MVGREADVLSLSVQSERSPESGKSPLWLWLTNQKTQALALKISARPCFMVRCLKTEWPWAREVRLQMLSSRCIQHHFIFVSLLRYGETRHQLKLYFKEVTFMVWGFLRDATGVSCGMYDDSVFYNPPKVLVPVFNRMQNILHVIVTCCHV